MDVYDWIDSRGVHAPTADVPTADRDARAAELVELNDADPHGLTARELEELYGLNVRAWVGQAATRTCVDCCVEIAGSRLVAGTSCDRSA